VLAPGYLCCNLRSDGTWASDSNYRDSGKKVLPFGTRVVPLDFGRNRINVEMDGVKQSIGNDYSRDLTPEQFAARWIVRGNPMTSYNPNLNASTWRYWATSRGEFQVQFGGGGLVKAVTAADPQIKSMVYSAALVPAAPAATVVSEAPVVPAAPAAPVAPSK
jgi:hypothetical protein